MSDSKPKKATAVVSKKLRSTLEIRSGGTKLFDAAGAPVKIKVTEPAKKE